MGRKSREWKPKPRVAVVGDGQTEQIYFAEIRDTDRPADLAIFPDLPSRTGNYKGVLDKAIQLAKDYDKVFALIDMDKVISDGTDANRNWEIKTGASLTNMNKPSGSQTILSAGSCNPFLQVKKCHTRFAPPL
jgi:hypothetical protein